MSEPRGELGRYAFGYSDKKPGWSWWLIHIGMVAFIAFNLIGCSEGGEQHTEEYSTDRQRVPVFTDRTTGCQYLGYTGHGLAARMELRDGEYRHMGCQEIVHRTEGNNGRSIKERVR